MLKVKRRQLADIAYEASNQRPQRALLTDTLTTHLILDVEFDLTIAAGAADGVLAVEQPLTVINKVKVFDGSDAIVDVEPEELRQITERMSAKALSGVALATGGVQGPTTFRQQIIIPFADFLAANPIETALIAEHPTEFYLEIEWVGVTDAAWKAALVSAANDRTFTFANRRVRVLQVHDPVSFALGQRPLFVPRIKSKSVEATVTRDDLPLKIDTSERLRWALLRSITSQVTTENIINRLSFEDDRTKFDENILARTWHEDEQRRYGGATDDAGIGMGYFFKDFADFGKLSTIWNPGQGLNPRFTLNVTGAANQAIRVVYCELARPAGIVAALPAALAG